jgi:hypothetical protein
MSCRFRHKKFWSRLPKAEAPEGWVKKMERRAGKVWAGFFHLWTMDAQGRRARTKKEKMLGAPSMPKHEPQQKLADYFSEYTRRLTKQGDSISTFCDLWKAFCAVKSGRWSNKTRENLQCLFGKHVVPGHWTASHAGRHAHVSAVAGEQNGGARLPQIRGMPGENLPRVLL